MGISIIIKRMTEEQGNIRSGVGNCSAFILYGSIRIGGEMVYIMI